MANSYIVKMTPKADIPINAKVFWGEKDSWYVYIIAILVLILGIVVLNIKLNYIQGLRMKRIGYLIGIALAILFMVVHELIHGLSCPKDSNVNYYYSIYGISCYPVDPMVRNRYMFMAIAPAVILGFIPMIIWIFIPVKFVMINSIIWSFSIASLAGSAVDINTFFHVLLKAPKESLIQASGTKVYWFSNF